MDRLCDRCDERLADADKLHCKYCVRSLLRDLDAIPRSELPGLPSKWSGPKVHRRSSSIADG